MLKNIHGREIIGCLLLVGIFASCRNANNKSHKAVFVKTETAKAILTSFSDETSGYGIIQAINTLDLEAKFDGIVHFESLKGKIKKGAVLYTLRGPETDLKKESLKKAVANAKIQFDYYKQYYQSQKKLLQKNFLSRIDFENAARDFENAQNTMNKTQYELNYFYSMTSFQAPFDGYLDNIQVPQGEDAVKGQLLGTFQDDNYLKLMAPYYGDPDSLTAKEFSLQIEGQTYKGKLIYKERAINPSSGGHTLWVALNDPGHHLKSGDYVSFSFLAHKHESVAVPKAAIIRQEANYFVITVKDGKYYKTPVKTGQEKNGLVEIKSGLKEGEKVLTKGAFEVFYGNLRKTMQVAD